MLSGADIIFYSGRNLEGKMGDIFVRLAGKKPTFAVTNEIDDKLILENVEKHFDPHLWFDVSLWSKGVGLIGKELAERPGQLLALLVLEAVDRLG